MLTFDHRFRVESKIGPNRLLFDGFTYDLKQDEHGFLVACQAAGIDMDNRLKFDYVPDLTEIVAKHFRWSPA